MKITCKYCGVVEKPHICPHSKRKTDRTRIDNKVYESKEYRTTRRRVLEDHRGICLWSLYVVGQIQKAEVTHHIIEILDDVSKATDYNNLIPLSNCNHHLEVHKLYSINKIKTQELLRLMLKDFKNGDFTLGKYKEVATRLEKDNLL